MKFNYLKGLAAFAVMAGSLTPAAHAATAGGGDLILGFRAMAGTTGVGTNYVVKVDAASALRDGANVRTISLPGVAADLAALYGANWHDRTDLTWGLVANTSNYTTLNGDPARTLYASKAEPTNGVFATPWNRGGDSDQSFTTSLISSFLTSGFNVGTSATNASAIANTIPKSSSNSWSQYLPAAGPPPETYGNFSGGISFQTWDTTGIEAAPATYQDLFRMVPSATAAPAALVGRFILESTGDLTFIPAASVGVNSVQFSGATFSAAEDTGVLAVTVTRSGDTSTATTVTVSTSDGTAVAGSDYTALTSQSVTFAALETSKTVSITVANRTGDQGSRNFTVTLGGNTGGTTIGAQATATGTITEAVSTLQFSATIFTANQEDSSVNVRISRTTGSAAVTVQISTTDGSGSSGAKAGTDYTALTNQVVTIPANVAFVDVPVTLSHPTATQPNKQFTVTLSSPGSGAVLDTDTELLTSTVRILATDTVAPTISFTTPAAGTVISGALGGVIVVTGSAADVGGGLSKVEVSVDGINFHPATRSGSTWNTAASGIDALKPAGGATTITARAVDTRGNTTTITRLITYKITFPATSLTVNVVETGGTGSKVTGQLVAPATYEIGKTYTFTAVPGTNLAFDHWTGASLAAPATELAKITFVFTQDLANAPTITATFKANPYLAANNVSGAYNGLVKAKTGTTPSNATNGLITVTQTGIAGAFSGTIKIGGETLGKMTVAAVAVPLSGVFDNDGVAKFGKTRATTVLIPRVGGAPYALSMSLDVGTKKITGALNTTSRTTLAPQSVFVADRAAYSSAAKVPASLLNKAGTAGYYTAALPARSAATVSLDPAVTFASNEFPQGDGYTTIAVTSAGAVTFTAVLGDGTAVTSVGALTVSNTAILFAQPYASKGSIGGEVALTKTTFVAVDGSDFFWFRPYQAVQHYPYGWPEGIVTDLVGSEYNVVAGTSVFPGLTATTPNTNVVFSDGLLNISQSLNFNISTTNVVSATGTTLGVVVTPATGVIGGKPTTFFTHTSGAKVPFKAIIVQQGTAAGGWGHFLTIAPKLIDGLGESGGVTLTHN